MDKRGLKKIKTKSWETPKGYLMFWKDGKNKLLHEFIWEEFHKQKKPNNHFIHHLNGDKQDNRIKNLKLVTAQEHNRLHAGWIMEKGEWIAKPCSKCKKILPLKEFYDRRNYGKGYSNPSARCKKCHNL